MNHDLECLFASLDDMQKGLDTVNEMLQEQMKQNAQRCESIVQLKQTRHERELELQRLRLEDAENRRWGTWSCCTIVTICFTIRLDDFRIVNESLEREFLRVAAEKLERATDIEKMQKENRNLDDSFTFGVRNCREKLDEENERRKTSIAIARHNLQAELVEFEHKERQLCFDSHTAMMITEQSKKNDRETELRALERCV